jgi:hypothetical protein
LVAAELLAQMEQMLLAQLALMLAQLVTLVILVESELFLPLEAGVVEEEELVVLAQYSVLALVEVMVVLVELEELEVSPLDL